MKEFDFVDKQLIIRPYENFYCDKCIHYWLISSDEGRCSATKLGQSDAMCAQIVRCLNFKEKDNRDIIDLWDGSGD